MRRLSMGGGGCRGGARVIAIIEAGSAVECRMGARSGGGAKQSCAKLAFGCLLRVTIFTGGFTGSFTGSVTGGRLFDRALKRSLLARTVELQVCICGHVPTAVL